MVLLFGSVLVGLIVYTSFLTIVLRTYSRSRLGECLPEGGRTAWLDWLDRREASVTVVVSFVRLVLVSGAITMLYLRVAPAGDWPADWVNDVAWIVGGLVGLSVVAVGIPNALAVHSGEPLLARSLAPLWAMLLVLYPIERVLIAVDFVVRRLLGKEVGRQETTERVEQEILDAISEGQAHGAVDQEAKDIIEAVLELRETPVSAIMTPRTDLQAIPVDTPAEAIRKLVVEAGHSRIPVYEGTLDHIVGMLYAKDLIALPPETPPDLRKLVRGVPFVPETKTIDELLRELRASRIHMAVVLDEYGGTAGVVTIEDILEEIVGEIDDEYDPASTPPVRQIDADTLEVDGRVSVYEVNEALGVEIPDDGDYETIAGFLFQTLGKIPGKGDEIVHDQLRISVLDAEPRKINRLRIRVDRSPQTV